MAIVTAKKPKPKAVDLLEKYTALLKKVNRLEKRLKELEVEIKKNDLGEITQVNERLHKPHAEAG